MDCIWKQADLKPQKSVFIPTRKTKKPRCWIRRSTANQSILKKAWTFSFQSGTALNLFHSFWHHRVRLGLQFYQIWILFRAWQSLGSLVALQCNTHKYNAPYTASHNYNYNICKSYIVLYLPSHHKIRKHFNTSSN